MVVQFDEPDGRLRRAWRHVSRDTVAGAGWSLGILIPLLRGLPIDANDFPLLLAAVLVSAWYGGVGPGLLATAFGALTGTVVSLPAHTLSPTPSPIVPLGGFLLEALVICGIS